MTEVIFDDPTKEKIKQELYHLILQYNNTRKIDDHYWELNIHDQSPVTFTKYEKLELLRFYADVKEHAKSLVGLIPNLSFESNNQNVESDTIIGTINLQKTIQLRSNDPTNNNLVCSIYAVNLYTPENLLLSAIFLGIKSLSIKFAKNIREEENPEPELIKKMEEIENFITFILQDRFIAKLTKFYYENYESYYPLLEKTILRYISGRLKAKYIPLLRFMKKWKKFDNILNEKQSNLKTKLPNLIATWYDNVLYEYWIFYKVISLFPDMKQCNDSEFTNGKITIVHHETRHIEYYFQDDQLKRIPDIIIKSENKTLGIIDAKYMLSKSVTNPVTNPETNPDYETSNPRTPDSNIVNQMIIYLDYGNDKSNKLGVVLYADKEKTESRIIKKISENKEVEKEIHFINLHPDNSNGIDQLKKIQQEYWN